MLRPNFSKLYYVYKKYYYNFEFYALTTGCFGTKISNCWVELSKWSTTFKAIKKIWHKETSLHQFWLYEQYLSLNLGTYMQWARLYGKSGKGVILFLFRCPSMYTFAIWHKISNVKSYNLSFNWALVIRINQILSVFDMKIPV